jgi:hypothetical protein
MGFIAGQDIADHVGYKTAVVFGSVIASFTVENFSVKKLAQLRRSDVDKRFSAFLQLSRLD